MRRAAIGVRLTIWYAALLAAVLTFFCLASIQELRRLADESAVLQLRQAITGAEKIIRAHQDSGSQLEEELAEYADELQPGIRLSVRLGAQWLAHPAATSGLDGQNRSLRTDIHVGDRVYIVHARVSTATAAAVVNGYARAVLIAAPALLAFACAAGFWISRQALQPVDAITKAARSISVESLSGRLTEPASRDELYRLTKAWNEMLARLEQSVGRLAQFTADASHELRSPLAVIRTTAELALRRDRDAAQYRSALDRICDYAVSLSTLIDDLLMLARTDRGINAFTNVELQGAVCHACAMLSPLAELKQIQVQLHFDTGVPQIPGDAQSLERLAAILLDNAIKYAPQSGEVSVSVSEKEGGRVGLEVRDNGPGITSEHLPYIFDRFYRANRVRTPGAAGAGLGLALAKSIATAHGAEIEVETEINLGSTFRVVFPSARG
ncbi:MAG TPA: ATP-binding protein [Bryobacteraceae bacterium]|jgi:heavy metal sensor kinase|nr:ATP-binding protein [Bryobacteraceae bacterium]